MSDICYTAFHKKLLEALSLEKEIDEIEKKHQILSIKTSHARITYNYLIENNYIVDSKLKIEIENHNAINESYNLEIQDKISLFKSICEDIRCFDNFRYIVYCLAKEKNLSLYDLAAAIGCTNCNALEMLCKEGRIDEENYIKLCNFFDLDVNRKAFVRFCPSLRGY